MSKVWFITLLQWIGFITSIYGMVKPNIYWLIWGLTIVILCALDNQHITQTDKGDKE